MCTLLMFLRKAGLDYARNTFVSDRVRKGILRRNVPPTQIGRSSRVDPDVPKQVDPSISVKTGASVRRLRRLKQGERKVRR